MATKTSQGQRIDGGYYIKARKTQASDIQHQPPHVREIWDLLICRANFDNHKLEGNKSIHRGQLHCVISDIREALHWKVGWIKHRYTQSACESAIKWLRSADMIKTTRTGRGTIITVCNYEAYQNPANYESQSDTVEPSASPFESQSEKPNDNQSGKQSKGLQSPEVIEYFQRMIAEQDQQAITDQPKDQNPNHTKEGSKKSTKQKRQYLVVYDHWNAKQIVVHKKLTEKIKQKINTHLRDNSLEDITQAIDNYNTALKSPEYFFKFKWPLIDFLDRGLRKFVDEAQPLSNFQTPEAKERTAKRRAPRETPRPEFPKHITCAFCNQAWTIPDAAAKCGKCNEYFYESTARGCRQRIPKTDDLITCSKCQYTWSYKAMRCVICPNCKKINTPKIGNTGQTSTYSQELIADCRETQEEIKVLSDKLLRNVPPLTNLEKEALNE